MQVPANLILNFASVHFSTYCLGKNILTRFCAEQIVLNPSF